MPFTICQHIRELRPKYINNLLKLIQVYIKLETLNLEDWQELKIIELLQGKRVCS